MRQSETRYNDLQSAAFIEGDGVWIIFLRPVPPTRDASGGVTSGGTPTKIKPQRCRVLPARSRSTRLSFFTPQGEILQSRSSVIMGMPDLDVQAGDEFVWRGKTYKVQFVNPDTTYGTIAQIDLLGATDRDTL